MAAVIPDGGGRAEFVRNGRVLSNTDLWDSVGIIVSQWPNEMAIGMWRMHGINTEPTRLATFDDWETALTAAMLAS